MKRLLLFFAIMLNAGALFAQTPEPADSIKWEKDLRLRFFANHIFQENWTKGGEEAFNWKLDVENDFSRESARFKWDNKVRLRYAQNTVGNGGELERRVTLNEFIARSAVIFKKTKTINPFLGATLNTQAAKGYQYPADLPREARSSFWDPVTIAENFGFDFSGIKDTKLRLSVDLKQQIADNFVQFYNIDDPETENIEKLKVTKGMTVWSEYKRAFREKFMLKTEFEANYAFEHVSSVVIDTETTFDIKLVKFLNFSIVSQYRFDRNESKQGQFKNTMGLSLFFDLLN